MFDSGTTLPLRHFNTSANKRSSKPEARLVPLVPALGALSRPDFLSGVALDHATA
jgi:hypothetical protein